MPSEVVHLAAGQNVLAPDGLLEVNLRPGLDVSVDVLALLVRRTAR